MDYKYIEQLLERYWACETSLEEERILRTFFSQKEMPESLMQYRDLFTYEQSDKEDNKLGEDFDARILSMIEEPTVKLRVVSIRERLMPLFKAAAVVAIILTLGNAAQWSFGEGGEEEPADINYANYKDTYSDPAVAYDNVENALELVSEGISRSQKADTLVMTRPAKDGDSVATKQ